MALLLTTFVFVLLSVVLSEYIEVGNVHQWREEDPVWKSEIDEVIMGPLSTRSRGVKGEVSFFGKIYLKIYNFTFEGILKDTVKFDIKQLKQDRKSTIRSAKYVF